MEEVRMKRIDIIYKKLSELSVEKGVTTDDIAKALGLKRPNVSCELNKLCEQGRAVKEGLRPVLFKAKKAIDIPKSSVLDKFSQKNPSLFSAIQQAKAAVLYPPNGMHILILGETGTGKSMFAGLIHQYSIEAGRMPKISPFVVFNCADYANNPQLLLSQLFGAKKGAYTGADSDKAGLVEKAHGGILFLDEVHRLPPEGQEMFFSFIDTGKYRRLGETDGDRTSKVLIISATTENPDSSLLRTFTRRIPMFIKMPSLHERNIDERLNLITQFFREESCRLGKPISVSINSMKSFLSYHCPNNVGQLKTDIQLACAKAYADFISDKKEFLKINSPDLPPYIRDGLFWETEHRQLWTKLIAINKRYCIFDSSEENILFEEDDEETIYDMIDLRVHELKSKGVTSEVLEQEMEKDIQEYFSSYLQNVNQRIDFSNLESIVSPNIIRVVEEIIRFSEEKLGKTFSTQIHYGMAVHISNSIKRIKRGKKIINPQFNKIRTQYNEEFTTAVDCLKIINRVLDITMPIDEAGFLAMFFVYHEGNIKEPKNNVKIIIIAHGSTTATSMAEAANSLLGVKYAIGINAPLDEKPQEVIAQLKEFLKKSTVRSDILFLVDMGSLTNFGEEIAKEFGIQAKTIPLVSTLHVIEATRKAIVGYSLDEVYEDTLRVNEFLDNDYLPPSKINVQEAFAIVTLCTTGDGGAALIKNILEKELNFGSNPAKIIPMSIIENEDIEAKIENIKEAFHLICVVGSFCVNTDVPQYRIDQVFVQSVLQDIQKLIDIEKAYLNIEDTFKNHLPNINSNLVIQGIKNFIRHMEDALHIKLTTSVLIGIAMHLGCMVDRLKSAGSILEFKNKQPFIAENLMLYSLVKNECAAFNERYQIQITDDEICHLMVFLDPKNNI
jgi:transcriptional regulator with AAA-type ATPase domain/transcriptional regulatory protein LevR